MLSELVSTPWGREGLVGRSVGRSVGWSTYISLIHEATGSRNELSLWRPILEMRTRCMSPIQHTAQHSSLLPCPYVISIFRRHLKPSPVVLRARRACITYPRVLPGPAAPLVSNERRASDGNDHNDNNCGVQDFMCNHVPFTRTKGFIYIAFVLNKMNPSESSPLDSTRLDSTLARILSNTQQAAREFCFADSSSVL